MKDKYIEPMQSEREKNLYSLWFIVVCILLMLLFDTEWTIKIFMCVALAIIALFSSVWWLIVSIPLGVWLLLLLLNRD